MSGPGRPAIPTAAKLLPPALNKLRAPSPKVSFRSDAIESNSASASIPPSQRSIQEDEGLDDDDEAEDDGEEYDDEGEFEDEELAEEAESESSESDHEYHVPEVGNRRPHMNVHIWDQLVKLIKDDKINAVKHIYATELVKDDAAVQKCTYANRQDATGATFLHYTRSAALAHFICSFPGTNLQLSDHQGATALWAHLDQSKDKKYGAQHRAVAKTLVEHGADIFAKNILKGPRCIDLVESREFEMQLRRLANAAANRIADPLVVGEARQYYRNLFDTLDVEKKGVVTTKDIIQLWYAKRNEELFIQAVTHPEIIEQALALPPPAKPKKQPKGDKKGDKKDAPAGKGGKKDEKAATAAPKFPMTEEDRLDHFLAHWDIDGDGRFSFPDFCRMILEFDRSTTPERKFVSSMIDTPRVAGATSRSGRTVATGHNGRSRRQSMIQKGSRVHTGRHLGTGGTKTPNALDSSRIREVAKLMGDVNVFAMTATQELKNAFIVDAQTPKGILTPNTPKALESRARSREQSRLASAQQSPDLSRGTTPGSIAPGASPSTKGVLRQSVVVPSASSDSESDESSESDEESEDDRAEGGDPFPLPSNHTSARASDEDGASDSDSSPQRSRQQPILPGLPASPTRMIPPAQPSRKTNPDSIPPDDALLSQGPARSHLQAPALQQSFPSPNRGKQMLSPTSSKPKQPLFHPMAATTTTAAEGSSPPPQRRLNASASLPVLPNKPPAPRTNGPLSPAGTTSAALPKPTKQISQLPASPTTQTPQKRVRKPTSTMLTPI